MATDQLRWPDGKSFGFTIVDDTDFARLAKAKPVYDFLADCGMRTTKTVWPLRPTGEGLTGGATLEDRDYREWILSLERRGFEIALHGVADGTSCRERVEQGLDYFRTVLGNDPALHTNHVAQGEGIYWGPSRLDPPLRWLYEGYRKGLAASPYGGTVPGSSRFWGDMCRHRIKYVRNFVFQNINTLKMDRMMPYHDPHRPYVRNWFSASNGAVPESFCRLLSEANQDRLAEEGGACIVYTHFGCSFHPLQAEFRRLMLRLSRMAGWFVPATTLLDHVGAQRGWRMLGEDRSDLTRMQWRWAFERSMHEVQKAFSRIPWRNLPQRTGDRATPLAPGEVREI
jgi:hypothetical protein